MPQKGHGLRWRFMRDCAPKRGCICQYGINAFGTALPRAGDTGASREVLGDPRCDANEPYGACRLALALGFELPYPDEGIILWPL
jgi:hypothetical protein